MHDPVLLTAGSLPRCNVRLDGPAVGHTPGVQSRLRPHQIGIVLAGGGMLLVSLDSLGFRLTRAASWDNAFWFGVFTASAMFVLVPLWTGRSFLAAARADGLPVLASGLLQTGSTTFFILAIGATTVSNTVVIVAASPVLAALIARFAIGERTTVRTWLAIAASIAGILLVVSGSFGSGRIEGDLYAVFAITSFSINLTLWRRYPELNRAVAVGLAGLGMAVIAIVPADPLGVGLRAVLILAVLGGIAGPAGRIAIATSTRYLPAAQVSLFTPVETVAATAWAWLFLSESPPGLTVAGGGIVLLAVAYGSAQQPAVSSDIGDG